MRRVISTTLGDQQAERARLEHARAIEELQRQPLAGAVVVEAVSLADGIATPVPHGLGRLPRFVLPSAPRGPSTSGRIEEVRSTTSTLDRRKFVVLTANGWGATIVVDVVIG